MWMGESSFFFMEKPTIIYSLMRIPAVHTYQEHFSKSLVDLASVEDEVEANVIVLDSFPLHVGIDCM